MHILMTGGTGFLGRAVAARCDRVTVLSRDPERASHALPGARSIVWRPEVEEPPPDAFAGVDAVLNLAGESIGAGRWSREKRERLRESRVGTTHRLVGALSRLASPPRTLVSASALGYYGDRGEEQLTEEKGPGVGFLAELARDWEAEARAAERFGMRVVHTRIALVLGSGGGALARLAPMFRLGLGGRLGGGRQWMSWIHLADLADLLLFVAHEESIRGAVNAGSPEPVRNAEFARLLARALRRPALLPAPAFALELVLGEFGRSLLASVRMVPAVAERAGFRFRYPDLSSALAEVTGRASGS